MKRLPCNYCAARGGKKHAVGCRRPQTKQPKVTEISAGPKATLHPTARPGEVLRNRIALVIDASSSMGSFRNRVPQVVNEQIAEIKKNAAKLGQPTSLTIYQFNDFVTQLSYYEDVFAFREFTGYYPHGNTALLDAVGKAIEDFKISRFSHDPNTSFLIVTITDGEENQSKRFGKMDGGYPYKMSLPALMREVERSDRWTFAFSVPRGGRQQLTSLNIPDGNVQEWEQTEAGFTLMSVANTAGLSNYYGARSQGMTRSVNFFQPDMSRVSTRAVQRLDDLSRDFHVWNVNDRAPIREFVEDKLSKQPALARTVGSNYEIGRGYYQLTKSEEVQASKDMAILDTDTNAIYGGDQARRLIGCPMGTSFKIKPGNHGSYEIFIKSTSVNRKLMPGTKMLYFVG